MELEADAEVLGDRTGAVGIVAGFGPNPMVDVMRRDGAAVVPGERSDRRGVRTTRKRTRDRGARGGKGAACEQVVEQAQNSCSRLRLPPG